MNHKRTSRSLVGVISILFPALLHGVITFYRMGLKDGLTKVMK